MDGASSATVVIQLIQNAAQMSALLTEYAMSVKEAESSCRKLSEDLKLLSNAAKVVQTILERSSTQNTSQRDIIREWFRDDSPLIHCKKEIDRLSHSLDRKVKTRMKWTKRLKWPFKEKKINAAIQTFERYRPYLQMILEIEASCAVWDIQHDIQEVRQDIGQDVKDVRQHLNAVGEDVKGCGLALNDIAAEQERTKIDQFNDVQRVHMKTILDWFDAFDCTLKHESTRKLRQSETCRWLFEVPSFVEWCEGKVPFLWLNGIAGSGKSVLSSSVIDKIEGGLVDGEKLVFFYLDFRSPRTTSSMEVLRSLFVQLLRNAAINWLSMFNDLVQRKDGGAGPPSDHDSLVRLFKRAAMLYKRPMVVIDALDECKDLPQLLSALASLNDGHIQLFCVSRPCIIIKEQFSSLPSITLSDMTGPLLEDMKRHVAFELECRRNLKRLEKDQKERIQRSLVRKAQGMFQWVTCQLDRLDKCCSLADIDCVLHSLPPTLYETYDRILDEIEERGFGSAVVQRVLLWLVAAQSRVGLHELFQVLKIDLSEPVLNASIGPMHAEDILEICGSLVRLDADTVTLSHYTVQEYLTDPNSMQRPSSVRHAKYFIFMPEAHLQVAKLSMHYIITYINQFDFVHVNHDYSFLQFAVHEGPSHISYIPEEDDSLLPILATLQEHVSGNPKFQVIPHVCWPPFTELQCPRPALRMIIKYGSLWLLERYVDQYPIGLVNRDSPLTYAVEFDKVPQAKLLLEHGVDVNAEGAFRDRFEVLLPLEAAARQGSEEFIKLYFARGGCVPPDILFSISTDNARVVPILVELGADARPKDDKTVLHTFLNQQIFGVDDLETVKALVQAGCVPGSLPCRGQSLLVLAVAGGQFSVAEWLLDLGCQPSIDFLPRALSISGSFATTSIIKWPLGHGILVNSQTGDSGDNALHVLMGQDRANGIKEAAKALIDAGCDLNSQNTDGKTPLHLAATRQSTPVVEYLISRGAQVHANIIHSLLSTCTEKLSDFESKLRALMRLGMDIKATSLSFDSAGNSILHALCGHRVWEISTLRSPWRSGGRFPDLDDDLDEWNYEQLAEGSLLRRARLLQELGCDLTVLANSYNNDMFTPRIALDYELPSPDIVSFLVDVGESFSKVNYMPLENLNWASDLPWYSNAVVACRNHIMDTAVFWACASVTHHDVAFGRDTTQVLSVPEFPPTPHKPVIQRIVFSYAGKYRDGRAVERRSGISRSIQRNGIVHDVFSDELELKRFSSDRGFYWIYHTTTEVFWDRRRPSARGLNSFELAPGDALVLRRSAPGGWLGPELELDFYRIDMYYSLDVSCLPSTVDVGE